MISTLLLSLSLLGSLVINALLWAWLLQVGCRWAKIPDVTFKRAIFIWFALSIGQGVLAVAFYFLTREVEFTPAFELLQLACFMFSGVVLLVIFLKAKVLKAIQAWLPTLIISVVMAGFVVLIFRPFLFEAFIIPSNSMAPTLRGVHCESVCPECGKSSYCSVSRGQDPVSTICENFHITKVVDPVKTDDSGDRILVAKFFQPKRWDIMVFVQPGGDQVIAKRVVGFPGERVHIEDGAVWIDGVKQTPPDSIANIKYSLRIPAWDIEATASKENPAQLGDDEYFVLGDFADMSFDSRYWREGASGHNAFAVPKSHIKGIVTHTYWPPSRWKIHR